MREQDCNQKQIAIALNYWFNIDQFQSILMQMITFFKMFSAFSLKLCHKAEGTHEMVSFLSFIFIVLITFDSSQARSISVLITKTDDRNTLSKGIDVQLIKAFARTYKHKVRFIISNETLNTIFDSDNTIKKLSKLHTILAQL